LFHLALRAGNQHAWKIQAEHVDNPSSSFPKAFPAPSLDIGKKMEMAHPRNLERAGTNSNYEVEMR